MIIVRYRGGLGNQMFQYAFQLALQKRFDGEAVKADLTHYRLNKEHNGFELKRVFQVAVPLASGKEIKTVSPYYNPPVFFERMPSYIQRVISGNLQYRYFELQKNIKKEVFYRQEYHSSYEPQVFEIDGEKNWYLDGLWQDFRYFEDCEDEVRRCFVFQNENRYTKQDRIWMREIEESNSIGIHVRRGDFVNSKFDICTEEYYRDAIQRILEKDRDVHFFFFSDEPDFVRKQYSDINNKCVISHDAQNSIVDMEMLSLCRHKIISNSTFAFWAAWLGDKKRGITFAPRYSVMKPGRNFELRIPEGWMQAED